MWKRDLRRYGLDELRRLLYGLHAILRLHTLQEEESYLSLADDVVPAARGPIDQLRAPTSSAKTHSGGWG